MCEESKRLVSSGQQSLAQSTRKALYLFILDYLRQMKAMYHNRWPTRDQITELRGHAARTWKYSTKAHQNLWDMWPREHDDQQPLMTERIVISLPMAALKSFGAVALDIGEWCSPSTIQSWLASFKSYSIYIERGSATTTIKSKKEIARDVLPATTI
jgi:hypothetical protein